jgi:DNA invertase Pin-like site-specific DNA recombinase
MTTACIYARLSIDPEGRSDSPENQAEQCRAKATDLGYTVGEVFTDRDQSAYKASAKRTELERMLKAVEAGQFGAVIVWKLDRLSRRLRKGHEIIGRILDAGAVLVSVTESLDTSTPIGQAVVGFQLAQAEQQSADTATRVALKKQSQIAKGVPQVGGHRMFGYQHTKAVKGVSTVSLRIDKAEAKVAKEMVRRIMGGESLRSVSRWLNGAGHLTTTGGDWSGQTVRQYLRNQTISGRRNGLKGEWPAIITPTEQDALLRRLGNARPTGSTFEAKQLLTGITHCGQCKHKMYVTTGRYLCYTGGKPGACGGVSIDGALLDTYVTDEVLGWLSGVELQPTESVQNPGALRAAIESDEAALVELSDARFVHRSIADAEWKSAKAKLDERIAATRATLNAAEKTSGATLQPGNRADLDAWWASADLNARRHALAQLIETVHVQPATKFGGVFDPERIVIEYNWATLARRILSEGERDSRGAIVGGAKAKRLDKAAAS